MLLFIFISSFHIEFRFLYFAKQNFGYGWASVWQPITGATKVRRPIEADNASKYIPTRLSLVFFPVKAKEKKSLEAYHEGKDDANSQIGIRTS